MMDCVDVLHKSVAWTYKYIMISILYTKHTVRRLNVTVSTLVGSKQPEFVTMLVNVTFSMGSYKT